MNTHFILDKLQNPAAPRQPCSALSGSVTPMCSKIHLLLCHKCRLLRNLLIFSLSYRIKMNTHFVRAHFSSDKIHYTNSRENRKYSKYKFSKSYDYFFLFLLFFGVAVGGNVGVTLAVGSGAADTDSLDIIPL